MENGLTDNFEKEIFNTTFNLSQNYAEIAIDTLISDYALKEIPIIKSLVSFYKIQSSIVARHNVKKILIFLNEFHTNEIEPKKLEEFKQKLNNNYKFKNRVFETLLLLNEKFIDTKKSQVLAHLFKALIEKKLTWEEFFNLSYILNNLNPSGYKFLKKSSDKSAHIKMKMNEIMEGEAVLISCGIGLKFENDFVLTKTGIKLYELGFEPSKSNY